MSIIIFKKKSTVLNRTKVISNPRGILCITVISEIHLSKLTNINFNDYQELSYTDGTSHYGFTIRIKSFSWRNVRY